MRAGVEETAVFFIDVQEKLFPKIFESKKLELVLCKAIQAFQMLQVPIFISEQYPKGLGQTIGSIQSILAPQTRFYEKEAFSIAKESQILPVLKTKKRWVLIGIEAHICILQSAQDLVNLSKEVVVLQDAIGSRDPLNKEIAIEEMKKKKIRISCLETLLFELLGHAKHENFKSVSKLLR